MNPDKKGENRQQNKLVTALFLRFFGCDKLPGRSSNFNAAVYKARVRLTIETLLLEADDRAAQAGRQAYVHLIGLGLGVWAVPNMKARQGNWYVAVCTEILQAMHLEHVGTLEIV